MTPTGTGPGRLPSSSTPAGASPAGHDPGGDEPGRRSEERAQRNAEGVAEATARFRKLAERVRQGARERAEAKPVRQDLAPDDPIAELERQAAEMDGDERPPGEPDDAEVDDILNTMTPLAPPPAEPQRDMSPRQWKNNKPPRRPTSDDVSDDDVEFFL